MEEKCKICGTNTFVGIGLWEIKEDGNPYPLCVNCTDLMINAAKQFKIRIESMKNAK